MFSFFAPVSVAFIFGAWRVTTVRWMQWKTCFSDSVPFTTTIQTRPVGHSLSRTRKRGRSQSSNPLWCLWDGHWWRLATAKSPKSRGNTGHNRQGPCDVCVGWWIMCKGFLCICFVRVHFFIFLVCVTHCVCRERNVTLRSPEGNSSIRLVS